MSGDVVTSAETEVIDLPFFKPRQGGWDYRCGHDCVAKEARQCGPQAQVRNKNRKEKQEQGRRIWKNVEAAHLALANR